MPVMKFRREPLNNISKGNHSNAGRRMCVAYMRLSLIEQLLKIKYCKKYVKLLFRRALTLRLQRIRPICIKKCLIYFGWDIIWKNRELSFFIMCWNATFETKTFNSAFRRHPIRQLWIQSTVGSKDKICD